MGHNDNIEHVYALNKRLPEDLVKKMRESFARAADKCLVTTYSKEAMSKDAVLTTLNRQFLSTSGCSDEEIGKLGDLSQFGMGDMPELIRKKTKESLGENGNS
jgi:hypothetical protein